MPSAMYPAPWPVHACRGIRADGGQCLRSTRNPSRYCDQHRYQAVGP